jgi:hypothetical protein
VYLTQYADADDFATVRKGVVNTEFFRWYRRKVLNRLDQASLQSTTRKVFQVPGRTEGHLQREGLGETQEMTVATHDDVVTVQVLLGAKICD